MIIYREADLDYIFIRAKTPDGRWASLSLNEITDEQFIEWIKERFKTNIKDADDQVGKPWTSLQKVDILNYISKRLGRPCLVMIKREARNEWDKIVKNEKE